MVSRNCHSSNLAYSSRPNTGAASSNIITSSDIPRNVLGTASLNRPQTTTNARTDASKSMNPSVFLCISEARKRESENEIAIASMNVVSGKVCPGSFSKKLF